MSMKVYLSMKFDDIKTRFRNRKDKRARVDKDLPLNVRWGSRVEISEAPFLLREGYGFVPYPGPESLIGAFSRVDMAGLPTVRFYMKDRENPDSESMLLVASSPDGGNTQDEIYLFREKEEIPMYYTASGNPKSASDKGSPNQMRTRNPLSSCSTVGSMYSSCSPPIPSKVRA